MKIIAFPHHPGHGGPGSFQTRFERALKQAGWKVVYAKDRIKPDVIIVVGGTKKLGWLWRMKRAGVPIIHRLDGLSWLHRKAGLDIKQWYKGEVRNYLFQAIHSGLASHIIYQSRFVEQWWFKAGWRRHPKTTVIYNGIDKNEFKPISNSKYPKSLLCVEGTLDYSPYAIDLLNTLQKDLIEHTAFESIILYGGFQNPNNRRRLLPEIDYRGKVSREELIYIYKDAVYLSLDVNAACPNTVVEALACGIPVIGFDTGALKELVSEAGIIVPYGDNPWKLGFPKVTSLIDAALRVLNDYDNYSNLSRERAINKFNIETIFKKYLEVINKTFNYENR